MEIGFGWLVGTVSVFQAIKFTRVLFLCFARNERASADKTVAKNVSRSSEQMATH